MLALADCLLEVADCMPVLAGCVAEVADCMPVLAGCVLALAGCVLEIFIIYILTLRDALGTHIIFA
jgi:hypothetical protein